MSSSISSYFFLGFNLESSFKDKIHSMNKERQMTRKTSEKRFRDICRTILVLNLAHHHPFLDSFLDLVLLFLFSHFKSSCDVSPSSSFRVFASCGCRVFSLFHLLNPLLKLNPYHVKIILLFVHKRWWWWRGYSFPFFDQNPIFHQHPCVWVSSRRFNDEREDEEKEVRNLNKKTWQLKIL